jgi:tetratricopeptide (TPR) repeat protein
MLNPFRQFIRNLAALGVAALLASVVYAQPTTKDYAPSDATGEVLVKYRVELDAKHYEAAIAILDAQITKTEAGSYDLALLYQIKAQTLLQKGDFPNAIEPLEKGLSLSDAKTPPYFEERVVRELIFFLSQLYFQEAIAQSKNPSVAATYFDKADKYITRWSKDTKRITSDSQNFYSSLLYTWAAQNPDHPDMALVKRALDQAEIGLHLSAHPKDSLYILKLVCLQQLNRNQEATEILELLVKIKPDSASYWQQLAALYLNTTQEVRAIVTIERAQAHGFMSTPKDNFNLIGIYFNEGQYEKAAELLEVGLKNGTVESDSKNWELLAFSYQQLERPMKQIETLKNATKVFPKSGQLEFMIAQAYQGLDQSEPALTHAQAAVAKGGLTKPHQVYLFLAYVAFQLKKFDVAEIAAKKAIEIPEGAKDGKNMLRAIEDTVKDRDAKKNKT